MTHSRCNPSDTVSDLQGTALQRTVPQPIAMDGVHEAIHKVVKDLPTGSLLDVGAGQGAMSVWARNQGFDVTAVDIAREGFLAEEIPFVTGNLADRWPFDDAQFDVVLAVEVLEHVENHYHFLRECCRVCRPGGRIVISTPNCHSIESRLNYLLTGFDDCAPRPINHENPKLGSIYMEHIHPAPLPAIELGLRICGFEVESLAFSRYRRLATALLPIAYPFLWWRTYRQLILSERNTDQRKRNRNLMRLFLHRGLLTGRVAVYTCRKIALDDDVGLAA